MNTLPPFDVAPKLPKVSQPPISFKLRPNGAPAVVGMWSIALRSDRTPVRVIDHDVSMAITRFASGADHLRLTWEHQAASGQRFIHNEAHVSTPGKGNVFEVTPRHLRVFRDEAAAAYRRKSGTGVHPTPGITYTLTITPVFRPGYVDDSEALRVKLGQVEANHKAVLDALAAIVRSGGQPQPGGGIIFT